MPILSISDGQGMLSRFAYTNLLATMYFPQDEEAREIFRRGLARDGIPKSIKQSPEFDRIFGADTSKEDVKFGEVTSRQEYLIIRDGAVSAHWMQMRVFARKARLEYMDSTNKWAAHFGDEFAPAINRINRQRAGAKNSSNLPVLRRHEKLTSPLLSKPIVPFPTSRSEIINAHTRFVTVSHLWAAAFQLRNIDTLMRKSSQASGKIRNSLLFYFDLEKFLSVAKGYLEEALNGEIIPSASRNKMWLFPMDTNIQAKSVGKSLPGNFYPSSIREDFCKRYGYRSPR